MATGDRTLSETLTDWMKPKSLQSATKARRARKKVAKAYPGVLVTDDPAKLMSSPEIDAIAVVTPVWTHYELAKAALENGKHVFVEKPFTSNAAQAEELIELPPREKSEDHGGPYLPVYRCGPKDQATPGRRMRSESSTTTIQLA